MSRQPTHTTSLGTVHIIGNQPRIIDNPHKSFEQALLHGANYGRIAQLIVASDHTKDGHKSVYPAHFGELCFWDGAMADEPHAAIVLQTADCPALILTNKVTGRAVLAHAGRPALTGSCNVVGNAVHAILGGYDGAENLEALVVGSICGHCFKHDHEEAKSLIEYFHKLPDKVFADKETGALDLFEVIRHNLLHYGVPEENIRREGPCTFETPELASYRRDKTSLRNTIIFVMS
jgi:copper oxidase (laccase) domain-containing protein